MYNDFVVITKDILYVSDRQYEITLYKNEKNFQSPVQCIEGQRVIELKVNVQYRNYIEEEEENFIDQFRAHKGHSNYND